MNIINIILLIMLREEVLTTKPLYAPSFISDWHIAKARNKSASLIEIHHGLDQLPAKVDVQIKVERNGEEQIFTGVGSAQRDDDLDYEYGGIVYKYNKTHVLLSTPYFGSNPGYGYDQSWIAYTGSSNIYSGPVSLFYLEGHVRVRIWLESDMPELVFQDVVKMNDKTNYKEIRHNLTYYPYLVTVQTLTDDGYMSDGQGTTSMLTPPGLNSGIGGVVFGYDMNIISLWTPSAGGSDSFGVFFAADGWSLGVKSSGIVYVKAWALDCSQVVYNKRIKVGKQTNPEQDNFSFPCNYSISQYLLSVQVRESNNGMTFYGAGSTMATGARDHGYGGVVYVYNSSKVMIWRPADSNTNGDIINIGGRWGSRSVTKRQTVAELIIRVFYLVPQECPRPDSIGNATFTVTNNSIGGVINYTCNTGYNFYGGSISRVCQRNRTWSGVPPTCLVTECPRPDSIGNATFTVTNNSIGGVINYTCNTGYNFYGGSISRVCQRNRTWSGVPPTCLAANECPNLSHVTNAHINSHDSNIGGHISYSCKNGYYHQDGNLYRYCLSNQKWSGLAPTCLLHTDVKDYRINKKNTGKYNRSLISVWETRTSVLFIGGTSALIIVIPLCACILPDIYTMYRHVTDYKSIYQGSSTKNKISPDKSRKHAEELFDEMGKTRTNEAILNTRNVKIQRRKHSENKKKEKSLQTLMT